MKPLTLSLSIILLIPNLVHAQVNAKKQLRQANKAYNQMNYASTVQLCLSSLGSGELSSKKETEALGLLEKGYIAFVRKTKSKISKLNPKAYDQEFSSLTSTKNIIASREELLDAYKKVQSVNETMSILKGKLKSNSEINYLVKVDSELDKARVNLTQGKEEAAQFLYELAREESLKAHPTEAEKHTYKHIALSYKQAAIFNPDASFAEEAKMLYEKFRKLGTKRIGIIPFRNLSGKEEYGGIAERLSDEVTATLFNDENDLKEFIEIVSNEHIHEIIEQEKIFNGKVNDSTGTRLKELYGIDELVTGKITQINSYKSEVAPTNSVAEVEIEDGKKEENGKKVTNYKKVKVPYTTFTQKAGAEIIGSYMIVSMKNAEILRKNTFRKQYHYEENWAGSQSPYANKLSYSIRELISKKTPLPPHDTQRVNYALKKVKDQLLSEITNYMKFIAGT